MDHQIVGWRGQQASLATSPLGLSNPESKLQAPQPDLQPARAINTLRLTSALGIGAKLFSKASRHLGSKETLILKRARFERPYAAHGLRTVLSTGSPVCARYELAVGSDRVAILNRQWRSLRPSSPHLSPLQGVASRQGNPKMSASIALSDLAERRRLAIVPAFNEEGSLAAVIGEICAFDPGFKIVVVDDGSSDRTSEIALGRGGICSDTGHAWQVTPPGAYRPPRTTRVLRRSGRDAACRARPRATPISSPV